MTKWWPLYQEGIQGRRRGVLQKVKAGRIRLPAFSNPQLDIAILLKELEDQL